MKMETYKKAREIIREIEKYERALKCLESQKDNVCFSIENYCFEFEKDEVEMIRNRIKKDLRRLNEELEKL